MVTKKLIIKGRVQGVGFRYSMKDTAEDLGVTGWVKNLPSGDLEAVVQGSEAQIQSIITWAKEGPALARVNDIQEQDWSGDFSSFDIRF